VGSIAIGINLAGLLVNQGDGSAITGLDYDAQGNLVMRNGEVFGFDLRDRLRSASRVEG